MMRKIQRVLLMTLAAVVLIRATSRGAVVERKLATPTPEQAAWQDLEIGMFIHSVSYTHLTLPTN